MKPIDYKYAGILSTRLSRFKIKTHQPYKANFRCYVCGDSRKSRSKARGWILDQGTFTLYYCHNCGYSEPLWKFLKEYFPSLYDDYVIDMKMEKMKDKNPKGLDKLVRSAPKFQKKNSPLKSKYIKKVGSLRVDHPARNYLNKRMIPTDQHYRIWYAPKFKKWVNSIIPNKFELKYDEPRLVFPFITKDDEVVGCAGRGFNPNGLRYITIMYDEGAPKIFGLNEVDFDKQYYVVEGAIDSLFVKNSVAMAGADLNLDVLKNLDKAVFVFDNEPRSKEILSRMKRVLDMSMKVVIWPDHLKEKDINDMIRAGHSPQKVIQSNIYNGIEGELKLAEWKKRGL